MTQVTSHDEAPLLLAATADLRTQRSLGCKSELGDHASNFLEDDRAGMLRVLKRGACCHTAKE